MSGETRRGGEGPGDKKEGIALKDQSCISHGLIMLQAVFYILYRWPFKTFLR